MTKEYIKEMIEMGDDALNVELENIKVHEFRHALKIALKEQDRDTRHACAEAAMSVDTLTRSAVNMACMNVRAL